MEIKLRTVDGTTDNVLIIKGDGTAIEDAIISNWHNQILEHLKKLKITALTGSEKRGGK